jgi:hypothetical protein
MDSSDDRARFNADATLCCGVWGSDGKSDGVSIGRLGVGCWQQKNLNSQDARFIYYHMNVLIIPTYPNVPDASKPSPYLFPLFLPQGTPHLELHRPAVRAQKSEVEPKPYRS